MAETYRRSTLAMAVLSLLAEAPMHPYRMQQLIRQRGKDKVVNVGQRASLYKVIDRLARSGLVEVRETSRDQRFPERTVYGLTDLGREVLLDWLGDALATLAAEFPEFPAALSFLAILTPDDVLRHLETREVHLRAEVAQLEGEFQALAIPRLFLVEDEYRLAVLRAELEWVRATVSDLRSGELAWTEEWARQQAGQTTG